MSSHKNNQPQNNNNNIPGLLKIINNLDISKLSEVLTGINGIVRNDIQDEESHRKRGEILDAIKVLVDSDRTLLLQIIVQLYLGNKDSSENHSNNS